MEDKEKQKLLEEFQIWVGADRVTMDSVEELTNGRGEIPDELRTVRSGEDCES